jgi:hypothetical protein
MAENWGFLAREGAEVAVGQGFAAVRVGIFPNLSHRWQSDKQPLEQAERKTSAGNRPV